MVSFYTLSGVTLHLEQCNFPLSSEQLKQLCEDGVPLQELREQRDLSAEKLANLRRKMEVRVDM